MLASLILFFSSAGWPADPTTPTPAPRIPRLHASDREIEAFHRDLLKWSRSRTKGFEEMLNWLEGNQSSGLRSSGHDIGIRWDVARFRESLKYMKRYERELEKWEQERALNPGWETDQKALGRLKKVLGEWDAWERGQIAPLPREAKK